MTEAEDTADDDASKLPEEPELMQLWRALIEVRDGLCREIVRLESHPRADAEIYGRHGLSERRLREMDAEAAQAAEQHRERVALIDRAVRIGTREDDNERGMSLKQLRELLESDDAGREAIARACLLAWWTDRDNSDKRQAAALAIHRLVNCTSAIPSDWSKLPDLQELRAEDAAYRRDRKGVPKGTAAYCVARVLRRVRGERVM